METLFIPIQNIINLNAKIINNFNIKRIIIVGDFNRDIGNQITLKPNEFVLKINSSKYSFLPYKTNNKTCCSLQGYGYNKNYDQLIDTFDKPILTFELSKESRYIIQSSDHLAILFVVKNFT